MRATVAVDVFVSVDGFAGSDGLPGYFGYFGPDLKSWIATESATDHTSLMGRRTYESCLRCLRSIETSRGKP